MVPRLTLLILLACLTTTAQGFFGPALGTMLAMTIIPSLLNIPAIIDQAFPASLKPHVKPLANKVLPDEYKNIFLPGIHMLSGNSHKLSVLPSITETEDMQDQANPEPQILPAEPQQQFLPAEPVPTSLEPKTKVCYRGLGCFSKTGKFFNEETRPLQQLPQRPNIIRPTFDLFTRRSDGSGQNLIFDDAGSIGDSNFDPKLPTKIIIHGFLDSGNAAWMRDMRRALLQLGDYNVIILDWSKGSRMPYAQATANARVIGALIAQMIKWLETEFGANREDFHLLGHSLGAHVSGYAGERLRESTRQLGRITGMDPAGPYFENTHPEVRLDPTDARFVDAIHTDGDSVLSDRHFEGGFGLMQPVGHVDFYPNGGKSQPGCKKNPKKKFAVRGIIEDTKWIVSCDHLRVMPMVTSTVLNPKGNYGAFPCDSYKNFKAGRCTECGDVGCAEMGIRASEWNPNGNTNVKMYLDTSGIKHYQSKGPL